MKPTTRLRQLLSEPGMIVAPGAYDGITGRLVEQAGFSTVYMSGAGTAMARGFPDFGLLTMSEMVENAAVIARSVTIPLIADADTGYGNELNVTRTVREYEGCGVAGIHIEDQTAPKRCGHLWRGSGAASCRRGAGVGLQGPAVLAEIRRRSLRVKSPELTFAVPDHAVSSVPGRTAETFELGGRLSGALRGLAASA